MRQALVFLVLVARCFAWPTLHKSSANQIESEDPLDKALHDLKSGVAIQKSEESHKQILNGHETEQHAHKESVVDPGSGKAVASIVESGGHKSGEPPVEKVQVDVPAAGIHKTVSSADDDKTVTAADLAQYALESGDVGSVNAFVTELVKGKKLTEDQANKFMDAIDANMEDLEQAEMTKKLDINDEIEAFDGLKALTARMNEDRDLNVAVYNAAKQLYSLYKTNGDDKAGLLLGKFAKMLEEEAEAGNLDGDVENHILDLILEAMNDTDKENAQAETDKLDDDLANIAKRHNH